MKGHKRRPQKQKIHTLEEASLRGIFAVRRQLSADSQEVLLDIMDALHPELLNAARLFYLGELSITVIGFSRFDKKHRGTGPSTMSIVDRVQSTKHPIEEVKLGQLCIFGSEAKAKLAISLNSDELDQEVENIEAEYERKGFKLRKDYNSDNEDYSPHCSIALLFGDNLSHFQDPNTLNKLDMIAGLGELSTTSIQLDPVIL